MIAKTLLLGALAALAHAQSPSLFFTRVPNPVVNGEPQSLLYATSDTSSPVTILLRQGPATNLQTVETLTTNAIGGQYIWTPNVPRGIDYALQIEQGDQVNYYGPLRVQGEPATSSMSSMSMTSSVTGSMTTMALPTSNATMSTTSMMNGTMTAMPSSGTGMTMSRNTTMSAPSLTSSSTMGGNGNTATTGAGFQGTQTGSGASSSQTGNAAAGDFGAGKSTVAFVVGAVAAVLYVQ